MGGTSTTVRVATASTAASAASSTCSASSALARCGRPSARAWASSSIPSPRVSCAAVRLVRHRALVAPVAEDDVAAEAVGVGQDKRAVTPVDDEAAQVLATRLEADRHRRERAVCEPQHRGRVRRNLDGERLPRSRPGTERPLRRSASRQSRRRRRSARAATRSRSGSTGRCRAAAHRPPGRTSRRSGASCRDHRRASSRPRRAAPRSLPRRSAVGPSRRRRRGTCRVRSRAAARGRSALATSSRASVDGRRERLLGVDVLAGVQCRADDCGVRDRRRQVEDKVDLVVLDQVVDREPP